MRKRVWALVPLLLAGCGDDEKAPPSAGNAGGGGNGGPVAQKPAEPPKEDPAARQARLEALQKRKAAAAERVAELQQELKDMEARHDEEKAQLPKGSELQNLRRTFVQAKRDYASEVSKLEQWEARFKELKRFAESEITGNLKTLRENRDEIEKKRAEINDAWKADLAESRQGRVEESPVRQELHALRDVKTKWLQETPAARAGRAGGDEKKAINDRFRTFLGGTPLYKQVVGKVLQQDQAPKGKTPDSYDYTDLEFFLLLELMEDSLDRLNIAAEKKVLTENKEKLDKIEKDLEALEERIAQEMMKGGDELAEYEELNKLLSGSTGQRNKVNDLSESCTLYAELLQKAMDVGDRQMKEYDEAAKAVDAAKKELRDAEAELKKLGA